MSSAGTESNRRTDQAAEPTGDYAAHNKASDAAACPADADGRPAAHLSLAPPQQPDEIGRLGGYRILKELGRGGMGVVYQAEDVKLKRLVALKAMLPNLAADAVARQRFLREAQAMAAVRHDHVVTVFQVDEVNGVPFLAMEFLQGMALDKWLKEDRKPSLAEVLRIGREMAEGLAAAHERGLIHRDVKPGNVWLDSAQKGRVKILDFGLARAGQEDVHLTRSGAILGTPAYMAPEQARGEKVDPRSDLFSLGCVLYKLCAGAMPFAGDTTMSLLTALALDRPKPVRDVNADIAVELSELVMKLLEKDPARRPASAREVVQALQALENQQARKQDADDRTVALRAAPRRRRRPPWILVAVAALLLLGLAGGLIAVATGLIRIQTPQGDYVIYTDDPDFFFQVHDGAVKLEDLKNSKTYTLKVVHEDKDAGDFMLEATDGDISFKTKMFTIKRGDKVALTALFEPKQVADETPPPPPIADAFMQKVAALPADKQVKAVAAKLKELNSGFDGKVTPTIEDGVVTGLQVLTDDVKDISPVRGLTGLRNFNCSGTVGKGQRLRDLSPLKDLKLTNLECICTQVSDLSPLQGMKLTFLDCSACPISDLSPLKGMPLTELKCEAVLVSDLSPLKGMPLACLLCGGTQVSDLSPLKGMPLNHLSTWNTQVSDLSPLRGMPLRSLQCNFKRDRDAEVMRSLTMLESINGKPAAAFWRDVDEKKP